MRFVIGRRVSYCVREVVARLLPSWSDRLQGQHARLRRPTPRRQASVALTPPRTPLPPVGDWPCVQSLSVKETPVKNFPWMVLASGIATGLGLFGLYWYETLEPEARARADGLASDYAKRVYGKTLHELTAGQRGEVDAVVKGHFEA